jgi:archaellum biogenesis ATPase FlaH
MDNRQTPNFENLVYLYVCKETQLFNTVDDDFFRNKHIRGLYKLTKKFYSNFKTIPFDIKSRSSEQIEELAYEDEDIKTSSTLPAQENVQSFMNNVNNILNTDIEKYEKQWLDKSILVWIQWENSKKGFKLAIAHSNTVRMGNTTPDNVMKTIKECQDIVISRTSISFDDDLGDDFMDAESHVQTAPENLFNCGFRNLNKWACEDGNGGFEAGTTTILVGESNIGKSIWLGNIAYNIMMNSKNVLLISLEMRAHKIYKRIGANAFDVRVSDYMNYSNDTDKMQQVINDFEKKHLKFNIPLGMLRTKKFSSATPDTIRAYVRKVEESTGKKIHVVVIDYLTEMQSDYGIGLDQMYNLHKTNVSDLARIAEDQDLAIVTAHQLKIKGYGLADIDLSMLGESSGIIHRVDNIWGIIQTPEMKLARRYYMKNMKSRDNGFKDYRQEFTIDYDYMRLVETGDMQPPGDFMMARDEATENSRRS